MSVSPPDERPEPTGWGTQRRLRALMNRAWSPAAIAARTGIPEAWISAAIDDPGTATKALNRQVAAAYDQLWNQLPPIGTQPDRDRAAAARAQAQKENWPPPMAWDDDIIDHPRAQPEPGWKPGRRVIHRSVDLDEDIRWIREQGGYRDASMTQIAMRLGVPPDTLAQAQLRAARYARRQAGRDADHEAEAS